MSGADLDGDQFWVVTQKDLLPRSDINDIIPQQQFDDIPQRRDAQYIDDAALIDYFLEHSLKDNTSDLSMLHEAYTEHTEQGMAHPDCLLIAKHHSYALDFAKTGVNPPLPKDRGIPTMDEVHKFNHAIFPHYEKQFYKKKFKSKMVKGRLYDWILAQIPTKFLNDNKFRADAKLPSRGQQNMDFNLPKQPRFNWPNNSGQNEQKYNDYQYQNEYKYQEYKSDANLINRHENVDDFSSYHWQEDDTANYHDDAVGAAYSCGKISSDSD